MQMYKILLLCGVCFSCSPGDTHECHHFNFIFILLVFTLGSGRYSAQSKCSTKSHILNSLICRVRLVNIKIKLLEVLCLL